MSANLNTPLPRCSAPYAPKSKLVRRGEGWYEGAIQVGKPEAVRMSFFAHTAEDEDGKRLSESQRQPLEAVIYVEAVL